MAHISDSKHHKHVIITEEFECGKIEYSALPTDDVNLIKDGYCKTWFNGVLVVLEHYKNNLLDGVRTKYYTNGDIRNETTWVAGVKHGKVIIRQEDGIICEYENVNGKAVGSKRLWDQNGDYLGEIKFDDL